MLSSVFQLMDLVCPAGVSTVPVHTLPLYPAAFSEEARSKAAVTTSRPSEQLADDEQTDVFTSLRRDKERKRIQKSED